MALGAAFGGARALVTMKHVGLNVAADPLFTAAYTGVSGALVVVSADDPGMASSQNEQDNRRYAVAAGVPMLEPSDSPGGLRLHPARRSSSPQQLAPAGAAAHDHARLPLQDHRLPAPQPRRRPHRRTFERDIRARVMIPAYARPAHRRLREKLAEIGGLERELPT